MENKGFTISFKVGFTSQSPSKIADKDTAIVLKEELETAMRLVGITDLSQVSSKFVNTKDLDNLVVDSIVEGDESVLKSKI